MRNEVDEVKGRRGKRVHVCDLPNGGTFPTGGLSPGTLLLEPGVAAPLLVGVSDLGTGDGSLSF